MDDKGSRRGGLPIVVTHLTKVFRGIRAVDDLSFDVEPASVTGFLGPNGAGKTTTLRCILGLVEPTRGQALIGEVPYERLAKPLQTVGAALESSSFHPGRSARDHLRVMGAAAQIPAQRADEVLALTGLVDVAHRRVGGFSMGMRQRLGLASALLGDPPVLVLDEPANGLDPAGINWLRQLLQYLAHTLGKTVLVSSHLLAEMEQTVDRLVIISRGRLVRAGTLTDLSGGPVVWMRTPQTDEMAAALGRAELPFARRDGALLVSRSRAADVGHLAYVNGIEVLELYEQRSDLEQVFLDLTSEGSIR